MADEMAVHGACHCRSVKLTIIAPRDVEICECNCSMCFMKGRSTHPPVPTYIPFPSPLPFFPSAHLPSLGFLGLEISASSLKSIEGKENLAEYRFNTGTAKHWFCKTCGICPLYVPRSNPEGYSVNWRCLEKDGFR